MLRMKVQGNKTSPFSLFKHCYFKTTSGKVYKVKAEKRNVTSFNFKSLTDSIYFINTIKISELVFTK